jgi:hypothetical protein
MPDLTERVAELERLLKEATPVQTTFIGGVSLNEIVSKNGRHVGAFVRREDAAFYVVATNALPALLAERERQGETFKRQLRLGTEDVRRERDALRAENERLLAALAGAYRESDQAGRAAIGRLCDVHIDRSGALLGQVRALAEGDTDA